MTPTPARGKARRIVAELWSNLAPRRPALCPEIELALLEQRSPLWHAIRRNGLWAVHETYPDLSAPPHWAYAWAGGLALARYLLDHPQLVAGRPVTEVGLGSGIVSIAAALAGARRVRGFDRDPVAVEAARRNAAANSVVLDVRVGDAAGLSVSPGELVLAADVFYEEGPLTTAVERWAAAGAEVIVADPARGVLAPALGAELARIAARTEPDVETTEPVSIRRLAGVA